MADDADASRLDSSLCHISGQSTRVQLIALTTTDLSCAFPKETQPRPPLGNCRIPTNGGCMRLI